jgi:hypothetical protein
MKTPGAAAPQQAKQYRFYTEVLLPSNPQSIFSVSGYLYPYDLLILTV